MTEFLLFRLFGPLCSWGEIAVGEVRGSLPQPTRSAVLGLLAGAVGLRREEEAAQVDFHEAYGLACLVEAMGQPLRDFQTVQVPATRKKRSRPLATRRDEILALEDRDNPIVSQRDYRQEALATACLWAKRADPPYALAALATALDRPVFVPYLGRKACPPALPFAPQLIQAETILAALDQARFPDEFLLAGLKWDDLAHLFWDEPGSFAAGVEPERRFTRRDQLLSRRRWQFGQRAEYQAGWTRPRQGG